MPSQACPFNDTLFREGLQQLPQHWLRHFSPRSISLGQQQKTWRGLKGWGRTLFVIQRGRLLYAPLAPTGCMLRRTPILAWALLETLERHPDLPDVSIPFNCRDQPLYWYPDGPQPQGGYEISTTATTSDGKPALVFSYTTGHTFTDIPFPDYTFWGLPYAHIPPWERWLAEREGAPSSRWENKIDKLLWVGTTGVGNGAAGSTSHRLRSRFARCAPAVFGNRLVHRRVDKRELFRLAWKCPPGECVMPQNWTTLEEQCKSRVILHFPGVSDWLDHFKHQLACGSLNVFVTEEPRQRDRRREAEVRPPLTPPRFSHFDWWSPLLRAGEHYVHVQVPRRRGRAYDHEICSAVRKTLARLDADPEKARCIAERGQQLARSLTMRTVYEYIASVLRKAASVQQPELVRDQIALHQRLDRALSGRNPPAGSERRLVTKRSLLRHVSNSTRPWIEKVFLPANGANTSLFMRSGTSATSYPLTFHRR